MKIRLKLCPFCGEKENIEISEQRRIIEYGKIDYFVECKKCNAHTVICENKVEAVRAWNRRRQKLRLNEKRVAVMLITIGILALAIVQIYSIGVMQI